MSYDYDLDGDEVLENNSPLSSISSVDDEDEYDGISGSSPLSKLMVGRAKELSPRRQDVVSRRDALLNAYKNIIAAQKHRPLPGSDFPTFLGTSMALADSDSGGMRMLGNMQLGRAKAMMSEHDREGEALKNQALSELQMNAANLGFLDKDQSAEMDLLKDAATSDYQQQMLQMKMLLAAMRNAKNNSAAQSMTPENFKTLGVPQYSGPDPYAGLDDVGKRQMRMNYEKQLGKDQDAVAGMQATVDRMKRFQQLNEATKDNWTGPGPITNVLPNISDDMKEMEAIAAEITPQMRVPGSGASSDFDAKMFQKATVGTGKRYGTNKNIAEAYIASKTNEMQKPDFLEAYMSANGHLRGAQQAWKKYLNDNPIFDQKGKEFELNKNRKSWQEYFGGTKENMVEETKEEGLPPAPSGYDSEKWKKVYFKMTPEQRKLFGGSDAAGSK